MEKKQKSFGGYFGKCFGIIILIVFLVFIICSILRLFLNISKTNNSDIISTIQFYIPLVLIIASIPISLIYAAIKSGK